MVRQRPRKTMEEVYGTKFERSKSPSANVKGIKGAPPNVRDYGYIITSNTPYQTAAATVPPPSTSVTNSGLGPSAMNSSRRKSARPYGKQYTGNGHKYQSKEEKDDVSKDPNSMKAKTTRGGGGAAAAAAGSENYSFTQSQQYDNKTYRPYNDPNKDFHTTANTARQHPQHYQQQHNNHQNHQHHQHNHHNHNHQDEDKDDDTEEFFQLIRQTVENAIGKSISELLNRNFRELSSKVDRFSLELKNTNEMLHKVQMDLNNKIVHYGEENSRHFRYLCMKSEYDKMFYQHQSMLSASVVPSKTSHKLEKPINNSKTNTSNAPKTNTAETDNATAPCTCRSVSGKTANLPAVKDPHKSSSEEEHNVSQKTSEVGMREILDQIQRFCTQMQMKEMKNVLPSASQRLTEGIMASCDLGGGGGDVLAGYHHEKAMHINREIFQDDDVDDDDEFGMSSDSMTPRSDENMPHQYGGMTMRTPSVMRTQNVPAGGGGGDA